MCDEVGNELGDATGTDDYYKYDDFLEWYMYCN